MNDSRFKARSQRLVDFGVLCNEIASPGRKHVSKALLAKLVRYRLPLTAMRDDPSLKKIAINRLSVLDSMHDYAVELNRGNDALAAKYRKKAITTYEKGDKIVNKLADERGDLHAI